MSRWQGSVALTRAALLAALGVGAGLAAGRVDLVLLVGPLVVGTLVALSTGIRVGRPASTATSTAAQVEQGSRVAVQVRVSGLAGVQLVTVRLPEGDRIPHGQVRALAVHDGSDLLLDRWVRPPAWGPVLLARPDLLAAGADGLLVYGPAAGPELRARVLPAVVPTPPGPLPPRPAGLVGGHRTRRGGEGTDLLDIRPFVAGDRLRRIDWRVSARRGQLHSRRTVADADADVVLCLDTRLDVTRDVAQWPRPAPAGPRGSLEVAVRAAAALSAAHLRHGDRVALVDLVHPRAGVRGGSGPRQQQRIRLALTSFAPGHDSGRLVMRASALPAGAVVVVLSPFLDEAPAALAAALSRRGSQVVAVDVLPLPLLPDTTRPHGQAAVHVLLAERDERLAALEAAGVPVLAWEPASMARRLRALARARGRSA